MISKQEGGPGRGRLLLPGEQGDWAARNLIPSLPGSLWLLRPGGELLLPGSGAPELPGDRREAGGAGQTPNMGRSFEYWSRLWLLIG